MIYVPAARKQKFDATGRLQAFVEAARKAKQLQEELEAGNLKPPKDEWVIQFRRTKEGAHKIPAKVQKLRICHFEQVAWFQ